MSEHTHNKETVELLVTALQGMLDTALSCDDWAWADAIEHAKTTRPCDAAKEALVAATRGADFEQHLVDIGFEWDADLLLFDRLLPEEHNGVTVAYSPETKLFDVCDVSLCSIGRNYDCTDLDASLAEADRIAEELCG